MSKDKPYFASMLPPQFTNEMYVSVDSEIRFYIWEQKLRVHIPALSP